MIDLRVKGKEVAVQPATPERRGKVVDLMAALKQSLERTAPSQGQRATERTPTATKVARKRRKA